MRTLIAAIVLFATAALGQDRTVPPDPNVTALPPVIGKGVQIYRCQQQQQTFGWAFVAPEATLFAGMDEVGTHGDGPTWRWKDGSAVTGRLLVKQPAPDGASIPWLLLAAMPAAGSAPTGTLAGVTYVRRSDTFGGTPPPSACDAHRAGALARVKYRATYTFYKAAQRR